MSSLWYEIYNKRDDVIKLIMLDINKLKLSEKNKKEVEKIVSKVIYQKVF